MWLWRLFNILSIHRSYGPNGPQSIDLPSIHALAYIEELEPVEARWLMEVVHYLDRIFLDDAHKKMATEREKANKKTAARPRGR